MKVKTVLGVAFALSAAGWLAERHANKDGLHSDPTRSAICAIAISLADEERASVNYNKEAHIHYSLVATFQGVLKGAWIDEVWEKDFWNLDRYIREQTNRTMNVNDDMPAVARRCMDDFEEEKLENHELLGIAPPPSRGFFG